MRRPRSGSLQPRSRSRRTRRSRRPPPGRPPSFLVLGARLLPEGGDHLAPSGVGEGRGGGERALFAPPLRPRGPEGVRDRRRARSVRGSGRPRALERGGELRVDSLGQRESLAPSHDGVHHLGAGDVAEHPGDAPRHHLPDHHPEGVHVGGVPREALGRGLVLRRGREHLRRHPEHRAHGSPRRGGSRAAQPREGPRRPSPRGAPRHRPHGRGAPEVAQLRAHATGGRAVLQKDVAGLDVAVREARRVQIRKRLGEVERERGKVQERHLIRKRVERVERLLERRRGLGLGLGLVGALGASALALAHRSARGALALDGVPHVSSRAQLGDHERVSGFGQRREVVHADDAGVVHAREE